jgi:hypothetical protein
MKPTFISHLLPLPFISLLYISFLSFTTTASPTPAPAAAESNTPIDLDTQALKFVCIDDTTFEMFTTDESQAVKGACPPGFCFTRNPPTLNPCVGEKNAQRIDGTSESPSTFSLNSFNQNDTGDSDSNGNNNLVEDSDDDPIITSASALNTFQCIDDTQFKQFVDAQGGFVVGSCPAGFCFTRNPPSKNPCVGRENALRLDRDGGNQSEDGKSSWEEAQAMQIVEEEWNGLMQKQEQEQAPREQQFEEELLEEEEQNRVEESIEDKQAVEEGAVGNGEENIIEELGGGDVVDEDNQSSEEDGEEESEYYVGDNDNENDQAAAVDFTNDESIQNEIDAEAPNDSEAGNSNSNDVFGQEADADAGGVDQQEENESGNSVEDDDETPTNDNGEQQNPNTNSVQVETASSSSDSVFVANTFQCIDDTQFRQFTDDNGTFVMGSCPQGLCFTRNPPSRNPCIGKEKAQKIDGSAGRGKRR